MKMYMGTKNFTSVLMGPCKFYRPLTKTLILVYPFMIDQNKNRTKNARKGLVYSFYWMFTKSFLLKVNIVEDVGIFFKCH